MRKERGVLDKQTGDEEREMRVRQTDYFQQMKRVQQGCCLSPTLFNIYIKHLATKLERSFSPGLDLMGREVKCLL